MSSPAAPPSLSAINAQIDVDHFQQELEKAVADLRLDYEHIRNENVSLKEDLQRLRQDQSLWKSRCLSAEASQKGLQESVSLLQKNVLKNLEYEKLIQVLKQQKLTDEQHLRQNHNEQIKQMELKHQKDVTTTRAHIAETERHYQSQIQKLENELARSKDKEATKVTQESQIQKMLQEEMAKLQAMYKDLEHRVSTSPKPASIRNGNSHTYRHVASRPVTLPTESLPPPPPTYRASGAAPAAKKKRVTFDIDTQNTPKNAKKVPGRRSYVSPPAASSVPAPKSKSLSDLLSFESELSSSTIPRSSSPFVTGQKRKLYSPVVTSEEFLQ